MSKKVVLITGAGRGLGLATAKAFLNANYEVITTDIHERIPVEGSEYKDTTYLKLDVTSENDVSRCATFIQEKFGRLDVLISNAGVFDFYPVSEAGADQLKRIMDVNFLGLANITKYFLPLLVQSKGRLIVISSESYKVPAPFQPYAVSKQALEALYRAIKIELSLKGIKCILIRPGAIQTRILDETIQYQKNSHDSFYNAEFDSFLKTVPKYINKISNPHEVAQIVLKAGTVAKPEHIYRINHNPLVTLLSWLPPIFKNYLIKKSLS
jgi:NAD(P)-dependent dehydrogenase (short-subunit alcohol dehydrogenase family)